MTKPKSGGADVQPPPLWGLRPGDHMAFLYETEEEHRAMLSAFLRQGLARGEKVVYIAETPGTQAPLAYLREAGVNPDPYLARGQLLLLAAQDAYLEGGAFSPRRMVAWLEEMAQEALAEGYTALRVTGEMTWALQGAEGSERLGEYEALLEEFFRQGTCVGLCQYDRRRLAPETLLQMVRLHPLVAFGEEIRTSATLAARAEAEQDLQRQKDLWQALAQAAGLLTSALDLDEVLSRVLTLAREVTGADHVAISLTDEAGQVVRRVADLPEDTLAHAAPREAGFTQWILRTGRTMLMDDVDETGRAHPPQGEGAPQKANPAIVAAGIRSAVGLPLVARGRALGVLYFYSRRPGAFREALSVLRAFADHAATALEHALLFREVQEELARRRQVEADLRASEARYRALAESSQDMILLVGRDGRILYANPTAARELGRPVEDLLGQPVADFLPPADPQQPLAAVRRAFDRGQPVRLDHQFRLGDKVWLNSWLVPIRDAEGQVHGILNVFRDVTEQERVHEELAHLSAFHEGILQSMVEGVAVQDAGGTFTFVNRAGAAMLGYTPEELVGQHWTLIVAPEHRDRVQAADERRARGESDRYEVDLIRKDGQRITVSVLGSPRFEGGKFAGTLTLFEDITEKKRLEAQLQQAVKMEAIGRLAGGVAHDFNNLLTAIGGYAHLLRESLEKDDPRRRDVEEILKATDRATSLTRQLLAFSRRQIMRPQVLNLNTVVGDMEKMLRRLIGEDVELVTILASDLGHVEVDPVQVEQVILNLAVNARDAMPHGGTLTIETANVFLDETYARQRMGVKPGAYVLLAVTDTGIGMDAETLSHVFEPFFTTKETGTGLGLSTVYGIVKQSGGHIWAYSEPGQGTTFKVYLPQVDKPVTPATRTEPAADVPKGTETILLVEDEEQVRDLAAEALRALGYQVLTAANGQEALQVAEGHDGPLHLLLTDVVMPRMGGRELWEHLSGSHPGLKVLYISGYTDNAIVHHGVLDPGTPFL